MKMKMEWKLMAAGLILAMTVLFTSCPSPVVTPDIDDPVVDEEEETETVYGGADTWTIAPGSSNGLDGSSFSIEAGDFELGDANGEGVLKVLWESDAPWGICELYAPMPIGDYSQYAGLRFDICLPEASINMLNIVRIAGEAFKLREDYVYRGSDDLSAIVWVTMEIPFADLTIPVWSEFVQDSGIADSEEFATWLADNGDVEIQLNLNPVLNGGSQEVDTLYTMYLDNIGFYKGAGTGSDDVIFYDFEPVE